MIRFTPAPHEVGERADVVVAARAGVARRVARDALKAGAVTVSGATAKPSYRLSEGDVVAGEVVAPEERPPEPEAIPIVVRYEDERVLVVSKPAGLVTHPAAGQRAGTLVNALLALGGPLSGAGTERPGIVHRLDKDTSGLLLVARDDDAHAKLARALKERRVGRRYLALVRGVPAAARGTIDASVGRHPARRWLMAVVPDGRPAVTHYRVLGDASDCALLDVSLESGRTHQVRVHLSHLGHPVIGDRAYGGGGDLARRLGLQRPFLHAWRLAFPHPDDGRTVEVADPLPEELVSALAEAGIPAP
ncbi:MAG: RluA family pseudouridine synthase [Actinomycetota bacterium]